MRNSRSAASMTPGTDSGDVAEIRMLPTHRLNVIPVRRSCSVVIGTMTKSSWSRPNPDCPFDVRTPMTWKGTFLIITVAPTAPPAGKRFCVAVLPRTATLAT